MKLYIKRDQEEKKGLFGGSKGFSFLLSCRIDLTPEENELVERYKQWDMPVHSYETVNGGVMTWTLNSLKTGKTVSCEGVATLLEDEERIKNACQNVRVILDVMASFGGEELVEF